MNFTGVDPLPVQVAGVEVEAEVRMIAKGLECAFGGDDVECDFGGMNFEGKFDVAFFEDVEDWFPCLGEECKTVLDHFVGNGGEGIKHVPDGGAGESADDVDAEIFCGAGGILHRFNGPFPLGLSVARALRRGEGIGAGVVVGVADELPGEVV